MTTDYKAGCAYGTHRVLEPKGVLPQAAWKVDNSPEIYDNEILIDIETLNIDAASFRQILSGCDPKFTDTQKEEYVAKAVMDIVADRGKMHNPVTGSGGMLLGRIKEFGPKVKGIGKEQDQEQDYSQEQDQYQDQEQDQDKVKDKDKDKTETKTTAKDSGGLNIGDRICTLVSLSLTPLSIKKIKKVHLDTDQIDIEGHAVIFESGVFSAIPEDLGDKLSLAILDVAGAPAQTEKLVKEGDTVFILGAGGKSGLLCSTVAKQKAGSSGKVIGLDSSETAKKRLEQLGVCDQVFLGDAKDAITTMNQVISHNGGEKADLTINCVNIHGTEMASILSTKDGGKVYFFSMATSFTAAALGAEGVGADVELLIGNGYTKGHAKYSLDLVRNNDSIRSILEEMFLS